MTDQDKPRILTVPGHGALTQEQQGQIAAFMNWLLEQDKEMSRNG